MHADDSVSFTILKIRKEKKSENFQEDLVKGSQTAG